MLRFFYLNYNCDEVAAFGDSHAYPETVHDAENGCQAA
jgi:hypothetical protein